MIIAIQMVIVAIYLAVVGDGSGSSRAGLLTFGLLTFVVCFFESSE